MQEVAGGAAVVLSMLQVQVDVHTITTASLLEAILWQYQVLSSRSTLLAVCGWASIQNPFFMLERQFERRFQFSFPPLCLFLSMQCYFVFSDVYEEAISNIGQKNDLA